MSMESNEKIRDSVRKGYSQIAKGGSGCCCGSSSPDKLAQGIGYASEDLEVLPEGANMGLSCGNPTAIANLRPGQVVLDLGSGGGLDVFIAARKVGPEGRAIGVDMTPDMLTKARAGIARFTTKTGLANVEFRLGEIEHLPVADASVDVVISNCVVNLSPDKPQVWREIARVLRPGANACISDLALKKPLPDQILESVSALVGCVAGAVLIQDTLRMAEQAGLSVESREKPHSIDVMIDCNDPLYSQAQKILPKGTTLGDYVVSADITTSRPGPALTPNVKELIAVGASITAHCQPCLTYHVGKARQMGIDRQEIREAVNVGHQVEKGSTSAMREFTKELLDTLSQDAPACCTDKASPDQKDCCS